MLLLGVIRLGHGVRHGRGALRGDPAREGGEAVGMLGDDRVQVGTPRRDPCQLAGGRIGVAQCLGVAVRL